MEKRLDDLQQFELFQFDALEKNYIELLENYKTDQICILGLGQFKLSWQFSLSLYYIRAELKKNKPITFRSN